MIEPKVTVDAGPFSQSGKLGGGYCARLPIKRSFPPRHSMTRIEAQQRLVRAMTLPAPSQKGSAAMRWVIFGYSSKRVNVVLQSAVRVRTVRAGRGSSQESTANVREEIGCVGYVFEDSPTRRRIPGRWRLSL